MQISGIASQPRFGATNATIRSMMMQLHESGLMTDDEFARTSVETCQILKQRDEAISSKKQQALLDRLLATVRQKSPPWLKMMATLVLEEYPLNSRQERTVAKVLAKSYDERPEPSGALGADALSLDSSQWPQEMAQADQFMYWGYLRALSKQEQLKSPSTSANSRAQAGYMLRELSRMQSQNLFERIRQFDTAYEAFRNLQDHAKLYPEAEYLTRAYAACDDLFRPLTLEKKTQDALPVTRLLSSTQWAHDLPVSMDALSRREPHPEVKLLLEQWQSWIGLEDDTIDMFWRDERHNDRIMPNLPRL